MFPHSRERAPEGVSLLRHYPHALLASRERRRTGTWVAAGILLLMVLAAWWFYPIWTGEVIPYSQWTWRMWMPTWV